MSGTKAKEMEDLSKIKEEIAKVFEKKLDLVDLIGDVEDDSDLDEILTLVHECVTDLMNFADGITEYRNEKKAAKEKQTKNEKKGKGAAKKGGSLTEGTSAANQASTSTQ